ncbi:MAG: GNAT family N-acetyltransferase [Deltaproteobacteria bacterium]|uniref:GNAT family N-acetyltransferase n=1 Tax=Desulfobacula sp. TaxID=2593537 RepID=UPI0019B7640C|nr:GNAT family N-acetyltransferase [Candidatus Desulfobacula maris]MBL6993645.1 GNAT family N-acetyltransferase [Desulfobacula sp.]
MSHFQISFMEKSDIQESARVLSVAMLNNPIHIAVFQGKGEAERIEIEKTFSHLLTELTEIVFLVKEKQNIIGVMRMKSCEGNKAIETIEDPKDENDIDWRTSVWHTEWASHEPLGQHWQLGPIGVLPSHQGLGIGSMFMKRFCKEVDVCKATAYLETDLDKNVRFYEKFGFKVDSESEIFDVKCTYMLRAPSA